MAEYMERGAALHEIEQREALMVGDKRVSVDSMKSFIKNCPAADVAPVVHGRWDGNDCTVCKLPWNYNMVQDADDWGYFDPMPDYCPNCGAKMDGGVDNDKTRI